MNAKKYNGSQIICQSLEQLGINHVFGLPGTQNYILYEALRKSKIHTILPTSEHAASFMANGYYRASGKIAVLVTIPGPGFTYALTGLAEAYLDSVSILHIVGKPKDSPGNSFHLQAIDQRNVAAPIVKAYISVSQIENLQDKLYEAFTTIMSGEPGPVILEVDSNLLDKYFVLEELTPIMKTKFKPASPDSDVLAKVQKVLLQAKRLVLFVGQGGNDSAREIRYLSELLNAPVLTTTSGRGILPENHPLSFPFNYVKGGGKVVNRLLEASDLILALGCKFSHNGSGGFRYRFPENKLIHVDISDETLNNNYPAKIAIKADVKSFLQCLLYCLDSSVKKENSWDKREIEEWRKLASIDSQIDSIEPELQGIKPRSLKAFFQLLRDFIPADACVVTDSGLHQMFIRKYFQVLKPRSLIIPTDFQSMGYGLPVAIGAKLAAPKKMVLALVGDGGFAMSGMELLTAVRERLPIKVLIFNDGHLGLIRLQQISRFGYTHAVDLHQPNYETFAHSFNVKYTLLKGDINSCLENWLAHPSASLLEVRTRDSFRMIKTSLKNKVHTSVYKNVFK